MKIQVNTHTTNMNSIKKGTVTKKKDQVVITIPEYATHVKQSATKYIKINGQSLYSGMNHFTRNKIIKEMKNSIVGSLPEDTDTQAILDSIIDLVPCKISLEIHNVPNYQTVKYMRKQGEFIGGNVKPGVTYSPTFDADNQWIWIKCFTDALCTELNLLPDDTVQYIPSNGQITYIPTDNIANRKLVFKIERIKKPGLLKKFKKYYGNYFN